MTRREGEKGFSALGVVLALLVVVVVVCVGWYVLRGRGDNSATRTGVDDGVRTLVVVRVSTGGIAGGGDGDNLTIRDGQIRQGDTVSALSQEQLQELADKIQKADFFKLRDTYACAQCADNFRTKLDITLGGSSHAVTIDDSADDAPAALLDLNNYIVGLLRD